MQHAEGHPGSRLHLALVTANPLRTGGMQTFTRHLLRGLVSADWQVTVALSGHDIYGDIAAEASANRGRVVVEQTDWVDENLAGDREYDWSRIANRRRWFRRIRPDVALFVQSSNTPFRASAAGAWLARVPFVTTHRTLPWPIDDVGSQRRFFGLLPGIGLYRRRAIRRTWLTAFLARHIVYNSQAVRRAYESDYYYPPCKGVVIANAVEPDDEIRDERLSALERRETDAVNIGFVGRLAREKRIDLLLLAVAALDMRRPVRLVIYGEGPEERGLKHLAQQLGIEDRIEWNAATDRIWPAYRRFDIFVMCSRRESSSNAVIEAMAAGVPVIVSDAGGLPELIGDGRAGVCVRRNDEQALTAALRRLIEHEDERVELGLRAREIVLQRHDARLVARQWLGLLGSAAQRGATQAGRLRDAEAAAPGPISARLETGCIVRGS